MKFGLLFEIQPRRPWGPTRELDEMRANHSTILGGPESCAKDVQWFADQGVDMLLLAVQNGSTAHDDICDSLRRFGTEVMPQFAD